MEEFLPRLNKKNLLRIFTDGFAIDCFVIRLIMVVTISVSVVAHHMVNLILSYENLFV